ncbi:NACHT domain- and WD repeat-containing protein 1-like [Acanthaster planci]|uniref:NACHT domain- and WD repeat-containing protein 1-like n=1 Tax=Acanthaster planci TaxID=133434 RepID=A0A8B7ZA35_ACAPL|nr:NACHT domain- and WD repeat-containing protein 1-like [Acanthaster planci]
MALSKERTEWTDAELAVLCGDLSRELPRQRSKVVRIFTSSTFTVKIIPVLTDTSVERNALMRETYPRLKDYCKSRHGLEFQVIDMRWGVRDEATDDHMTSKLCMREIAACQRLSVGPNFVTFLCQKYGYRPFPAKVQGVEFKILRQCLTDNGMPIETLDEWFICDDNCIPPVYVLQPISSRLPYFNRQDDPEKMRAHKTEWWKTFELLQGQLRFAANEAEKQGLLTADQAKNYKISVTHDEVNHGLVDTPSDGKEQCLCFIRKFVDLESKYEAGEASKFLDLQDGKVDIEARELLSDLRDKVTQVLPPSNIIATDLGDWTKDGVNVKNEKHREYIKSFLDTFYTKMVNMVEIGISKEKLASLEDPLHQEILQHLSFCLTKCVGFQGRDDIIKNVRDYVIQRAKGDGGKDGIPMVLYGESGSGKTSIMAKCAALVKQSWLCGTGTVMVLRFLGTSPNTSSIQRVLTMVCKQILLAYDKKGFQLPTEYNKLVAAFSKIMKFATAEKPLVIFLDSLDQLSSEHGAHRLVWLPKALPAYTALVVSTLPKEHGILEKAKERLPDTSTYVQLFPFSKEESRYILRSWLATAKKSVTNSQFELIDEAVAVCSLPLFLKLVFDQATQWHSYHPLDRCILKPGIQDMINLIFGKLEEYHGQMLVSRALAYITLSPTGLTETELEDLLSLDDDVLNDVYQYWMPPVRRIPPSLWTRVRNDLSSYLVDRNADGVTVMYWYHRQFIETARQRYLNDDSLKKKLHKTCAEYFDGTWSGGRKKPCRYSALQVERFGIPAEAEEDRKVSDQPLTFSGALHASAGTVTFNLRKLTQLPFHLIEMEEWNTLKISALLNFDFLLSKVKALSMQDALADFQKAEEKIDDAEISTLFGALRLSSSVISNNPDQLAPELIGRLMDAASKFPRMESLLAQAKIAGSLSHPLLPLSTCLQPPGGMMLTSLEGHTEEVVSLAITSDSRLVVTGSKDNTARIWQIENGTLVHVLTGHREAVYGIEITPDDQSCVTYTHNGEYMKSGKICVWNMETGDLIHRLKGHTGKSKSNLAISLDGKYAVTGLQTLVSYDEASNDTDNEEDEIITDSKQKHKDAKRKELMPKEDWDEEEYKNERRHVVIFWNLESGQVMHWLNHHTDDIMGVLTTEIDCRQVAITFSHDRTLVLWDILKGETIREMDDANGFSIRKVALSEDKRLLAVHGCEISLHSFPDCKYLGDTRDPKSSSTVETMYITGDNTRVISGHVCGMVRMYGTGKNTERTLLKRQDCFERDGDITSMAVTPNEMYVVAALKTSEAVVLNLETLEVKAKLPHIQNVSIVAVTPDGSKILTGSEDKNVRIWDVANLKTSNSSDEPGLPISKHDGYPYEALTLNSDDKVITTGSDKTIKLWDVRSGKMIKSIKDPMDGACHAVAISRDDTFMVGCSKGWYVLSLPDFAIKNTFKDRWMIPTHCVISPEGRRLIAGLGQPQFEIRFFYLESGQTLQIIRLRSYSFHMLRRGVFVNQYVSGMFDPSGKTRILQLIESKHGRVIGELRHVDQVLSVAVSPDERRLLAGCGDHNVHLWNLASFSHVTTLEGHSKFVKSVAFSPDGILAASGANGGEVIIWDIQFQSLKQSMKHAHESDVSKVIFSPDGRFLVSSAEDDNYIQVWDAQNGKHLMKYNTYAKISSIIMSGKCNTTVVTLLDGRVAFLEFSASLLSAATSEKSALHPIADASMSLNSTSARKQMPYYRPENQLLKSKTCHLL